jgi:hypothetical protein
MTQSIATNEWQTIPILPCVSIEETLAFWESLGYKITYKQTHPYQYGVVKRNGYELHFGRIKSMVATNNAYTGCLVIVNNAAGTYKVLSTDLKKRYGKVPHTGIPRISRMKPGATRFTLTDVSGNSVIFVSAGEEDQEIWEQTENKKQNRLQKAVALAKRFRDYKNDDEAASKILDAALTLAKDNDPALAEALVMRIEIASHTAEQARAKECRGKLSSLAVDEDILLVLEQRHKTED